MKIIWTLYKIFCIIAEWWVEAEVEVEVEVEKEVEAEVEAEVEVEKEVEVEVNKKDDSRKYIKNEGRRDELLHISREHR